MPLQSYFLQGRYRNLARLRSVAASHHIRLELLPDVFERHRRNTSRAHDKASRIYWHVEVVFRKAGVRHHQERSAENTRSCQSPHG
jgi:hypothetical protein